MIGKFLIVGDPHAKLSSIREIEALAKAIVAAARAHGVTCIIILGDLADSFEKIHLLVLNAIVAFFAELATVGVQVFYIVGNHDMLNNQVFLEDLHMFNAFKRWPNLTIIDRPTWVGEFLMCPYVPAGRLIEALGSDPVGGTHGADWKAARAIFCHQEFRGAQMGAVVSKHGDVWPLDAPQVVTGHIHEYGKPQPNILEVGAPRDVAFGDGGDKTISVLEFGDQGMVETRIDTKLPRKVTMTLTVADAKSLKLPENSSVRINLLGTSEELAAFKKTKEYAELRLTTKIIPKVLNPASEKKGTGRASYLDLLQKSCADESPLVREALEELLEEPNANQA